MAPDLLGAVFKAIGSHSPANIKAKGDWMFIDLGNFAARYGVPLRRNPHFVLNTLPLMRGALVAEARGELPHYSEIMFNAIWRDALNMGDIAVIGETLSRAGLDALAYTAGIQSPAIKDELKARTETAVARGVFGAPTFFVGAQMWWGQDRLDWVERALST